MALLNPRLFNPLYFHLKAALRDENIRYIFVEGGSSASKTYTIADALLVDMAEYDYSTMVFRRFHVNIKDSVYNSFKEASNSLGFTEKLYHFQDDLIKSKINDAKVRFRGLDDEENIKGIEGYNVVYNNEWSQFLERHFKQQRKRLRGRVNQKFICDWNPTSNELWQYQSVIDADQWVDLPLSIEAPTKYNSLDPEHSFKRINTRGDTLWIKVTYRDNYWVVGHPSGQGGFIDTHTLNDFELDRVRDPNYYRVYANGDRGIMRTGGEFWKQFNELKHVRPMTIEKSTLHISLDENVNPYVTIGCWQIIGKDIRQVHEIPCKTPENNAPKAAARLVRWLNSIDYKDVVFIYGDPSSSRRSTVDENNSSFYDKFIEVLKTSGFQVISRVAKSAPEVALSAAFINEIYEHSLNGYSITISDTCKVSISDYAVVKEDKDGTMLKPKIKDPNTGITYEPNGHFSDQKRYFICKVLEPEFSKYKSKPRKYFGYST